LDRFWPGSPPTAASRSGHPAHVELAFVAARRYGEEDGAAVMCGWIRQIAAAHGRADRYHETMTIAWARLVAHHVAADPGTYDFGAFAARYPTLLDKNLLSAHYSSAALGSAEARAHWVAPDLRPFPW
jgi:hypothetical protein